MASLSYAFVLDTICWKGCAHDFRLISHVPDKFYYRYSVSWYLFTTACAILIYPIRLYFFGIYMYQYILIYSNIHQVIVL